MIYIVIAILITIFSLWRFWANIGVKFGPLKWSKLDDILVVPGFVVIMIIVYIITFGTFIIDSVIKIWKK